MRRLVIVFLLFGTLVGCGGREYLNETYGRRTAGGANSVNGTSVLAEMFKKVGHRVRSWRYLSPSLDDADVIVWAPYDADAPSIEAVDWLDDWLWYGDEGRTLIYIGRDWEAAPEYWAAATPLAPTAQQLEFKSELASAQQDESQRLADKIDRMECDWFTIERGNQKVTVKQLQGELLDGGNPFAMKTDATKAELVHWSSLQPNGESTALLADEQGHPLISELTFEDEHGWASEDSRLILVENGGFLLNGALVNHERRKLAGRLIADLGPPEQRVVFLETSSSPVIRETDPNPRPPTGLELFAVWPIGAALAQIAALGIVYSLARWPVFGVPRRLKQPSLTDFGRHVHALARLLVGAQDRSYAETQLKTYFHAGASRREGEAPAEPTESTAGLGSAGASPSQTNSPIPNHPT